MEDTVRKTTIEIKKILHQITDEAVRRVARNARPERITRYYVEVEGNCFPPTQLIRLVTGDSAHASNAQRALIRLNFDVKSI